MVTAADFAGNESPLSNLLTVSNGTTDIEERVPRFTLDQNNPNPFSPTTEITFETDGPGAARVSVLGPNGKWIATLVDGPLPAGRHRIAWTALDSRGRALPSGAYLYRLTVGSHTATRKMILLR